MSMCAVRKKKNEVGKWRSTAGNRSWGVVREKKSRNWENGGLGEVVQLSALRERRNGGAKMGSL